MTLGTVDRTRVMTPVAIGLGLLALAARVPSTWAVLVTATVGAVGLLAPLPYPPPTSGGSQPLARPAVERRGLLLPPNPPLSSGRKERYSRASA
ncbi:MAG: hypothetical protein NVSMB32_16850 [Actinomycetota bacterium]